MKHITGEHVEYAEPYWVLHSPYPDASWRGLSKCVDICLDTTMQPMKYEHAIPEHPMYMSVPLLFDTREDAWLYAEKHNQTEFMVPVQIYLLLPRIREPIASWLIPEEEGPSELPLEL